MRNVDMRYLNPKHSFNCVINDCVYGMVKWQDATESGSDGGGL